MSAHRGGLSALATRTAEARRKQVGLFRSELGHQVGLDLIGVPVPGPEHHRFATTVQNTHAETLAQSLLFLADEDMVALVDAAATSMPDQELHPTDIITPYGFCYFAELLPDRSGEEPLVPMRAFSWADLPAGHPLINERTDQPALLLTFYVPLKDAFNARGILGPDTMLAPDAPGLIANSTVVWTYGTLIGEAFGEVPPPGHFTPGFFQRVAATFWTMAQQPGITDTTHEPPGAPTDQRRSRRAGITQPTAPVSVIRLHQREELPTIPGGSPLTDTGRRMKVRSLTRGFWRRQWYATVQQHRHIWIEPHWRGPADAPVVGGERVFLAHPNTGTKRPS